MEGAIIALLVGLVTAIIGYSSAQSTNEVNRQLTRETNESNQQIQRETNDLQQQLAGQANNWSIEQWNRENSFNSPLSQMQRLRTAGLNPSLVYGNGNLMNEAAASPAVNMANVEAMRNIAPRIDNPLAGLTPSMSEITDIGLKQAQIDRLNTQNAKDMQLLPHQIESIKAATDLSKSMVDVNKQQLLESASRISVNEETANKLAEEAEQFRINNMELFDTLGAREQIVFNQAEISNIDVEYFEQKTLQALDESKALAQSYRAAAQASLAKKNLDETESQYIQAQIDNYDLVINESNARIREINAQADIKETEAEIEKKYGPEKAQQEIKKMKQERITGYINAGTTAVRDIGIGVGAVFAGARGGHISAGFERQEVKHTNGSSYKYKKP